MAGRLSKYAFIHAKLRARISKILTDDMFRQMIRARSLTESIQLLRNSAFSFVESIYNQTGDLKLVELEMFDRKIRIYRDLEPYLEKHVLQFVNALAIRYELDVLKHALRLWFDRVIRKRDIQASVGYLYRKTIYHELHIDKVVNLDNLEHICEALVQTPYARIIEEVIGRVYTSHSIFPLEIKLDHYYYTQLVDATNRLETRDTHIARKIIGIEIDVVNIGWIVRLKNMYKLSTEDVMSYTLAHGYNIDAEKMQSAASEQNIVDIISSLVKSKYRSLQVLLSEQPDQRHSSLLMLDRLLEEILLYEVKQMLTGYPFTIGILLAYFILKENETKKIISILNGKYYNADEDRMRSML